MEACRYYIFSILPNAIRDVIAAMHTHTRECRFNVIVAAYVSVADVPAILATKE